MSQQGENKPYRSLIDRAKTPTGKILVGLAGVICVVLWMLAFPNRLELVIVIVGVFVAVLWLTRDSN